MSEPNAEKDAPSRCPVCHVVYPGQCRDEQGQKVWGLPHWQRPIPPAVMCTCTRWDYAKDPNSPDEHLWEPGEGKCPDTRPIPPAGGDA